MAKSKDVLLEQLFILYEDALKDHNKAWDVYSKSHNDEDQEKYDRTLDNKHVHEKMFIHFGYAKEFCNKYPERIPWLVEEAWMDFANEKYEPDNKKATMLEILREFHHGK
jgi:hypothetical protein